MRTVRLLTINDADEVYWMDEASGFCISQWLEENTDYAYGIFEDGELIGYCSVGGADDVNDDIYEDEDYDFESLLLSDVYIYPQYRKTGAALQMLTEVMSIRVNTETVYCEPSYPELIRLYEKVGFEQINENILKRKE